MESMFRNGNRSGSGQVFHTRTRPASLDQRLKPGPISKRIFLRGPDPPRQALRAPWAPLGHGTSGPILWPNKKKKCLPNIDFLSNQTRDFLSNQAGGEKEHKKTHYFLSIQQIWTIGNQQNPLFSQQPTDWKPFFFHYNIFPHQKQKQELTYKP